LLLAFKCGFFLFESRAILGVIDLVPPLKEPTVVKYSRVLIFWGEALFHRVALGLILGGSRVWNAKIEFKDACEKSLWIGNLSLAIGQSINLLVPRGRVLDH